MLERGFIRGRSKSNNKKRSIIQLIYLIVAVSLALFVYFKSSSQILTISVIIILILGFLFILNASNRDRRQR